MMLVGIISPLLHKLYLPLSYTKRLARRWGGHCTSKLLRVRLTTNGIIISLLGHKRVQGLSSYEECTQFSHLGT